MPPYRKKQKLPKSKSPGSGGFTSDSYRIFNTVLNKEQLTPLFLKLFPKRVEEKEMIPKSFYKARIILIPKVDNYTTQKKKVTGQYHRRTCMGKSSTNY